MAEPERVDVGLRGVIPALRLAECRDRLEDVAFHAGGPQLAAMVSEAKLLRATLVFASGSPLGAPESALIPAAVSIELLHLASLVHDDMIDDATKRRGVPAFHVAAGRDRALVVGDLLIVAAFDELSQMRSAVPSELFARSVEALSKGAQLCCSGQLEELDPHRPLLSEEHCLDIVAKKTGSLFSVAASLGASLAEVGDEASAALATVGTELGIAYQIGDDLRDGGQDVAQFATTVTYARAVDAVLRALDRVPTACSDPLRMLVDAMLSPLPLTAMGSNQ